MRINLRHSAVFFIPYLVCSISCSGGVLNDNGGGGGLSNPAPSELFDSDPAWSSSGLIAYVHRAQSLEDLQTRGLYQIWLVNLDGTDNRYFTYGSLPDWSPDGTLLAIVRNDRIVIVDLEGNALITLETPNYAYYPDWSPDGDVIAFDVSMPIENAGTWTVNLDGSGLTKLYAPGRFPSWDPAGEFIAVASTEPFDVDFREIYTIDVASRSLSRLTENSDDDAHPCWSADGSRITYSRQIGGGDLDIFVMNADGSNQHRITFDGGRYPFWSPDGLEIVYTKYSTLNPTEGNGRLWVMDDNGSNRRQLTGYHMEDPQEQDH